MSSGPVAEGDAAEGVRLATFWIPCLWLCFRAWMLMAAVGGALARILLPQPPPLPDLTVFASFNMARREYVLLALLRCIVAAVVVAAAIGTIRERAFMARVLEMVSWLMAAPMLCIPCGSWLGRCRS
jgi:hypothetical protein